MKFCVLGLGSIGMRHAKNLISMGHQVQGYDSDKDKMLAFEHVGGVRVPYVERFLHGVTATIIATPTHMHADDFLSCVENGQHIFVEKPIQGPITRWEQQTLDRQHRRNLAVMVGYNLRFHECVKATKGWLGYVQQPLWAHFCCAQYNNKPAYLRDGVILNWSHEIDLALYLLGPATVVAASAHLSDDVDDLADIILVHENGCRSIVHLDYLVDPQIRRFTIAGTGGSVTTDLVGNTIHILTPRYQNNIHLKNSFDENYRTEMQAFIDRIEGKETLGCSGEEGLRAHEICLKARSLSIPSLTPQPRTVPRPSST